MGFFDSLGGLFEQAGGFADKAGGFLDQLEKFGGSQGQGNAGPILPGFPGFGQNVGPAFPPAPPPADLPKAPDWVLIGAFLLVGLLVLRR